MKKSTYMSHNCICSASGISADGCFRTFTVACDCAPRYCAALFTVFIQLRDDMRLRRTLENKNIS